MNCKFFMKKIEISLVTQGLDLYLNMYMYVTRPEKSDRHGPPSTFFQKSAFFEFVGTRNFHTFHFPEFPIEDGA